MSAPIVISLCDLTGNFVQPWVDAGYRAILIDPQHPERIDIGPVARLPLTVEEALPLLGEIIRNDEVALVAGWPPCTDMAVSGARWFESKRQADPMFQAKAVAVAEQCRVVGQLSGAPWLVENPVSVLRRVFGKASHTFNPSDYSALEPADNYTKRTCLWTGGGFIMPAPQRDATLGAPDDRNPQGAPRSRAGQLPQRDADGIRACRVPSEPAGSERGRRMNTIRAALSLLRIPPTTEDQQTAALVASLRATSDADEAERFRAMLLGGAGR